MCYYIVISGSFTCVLYLNVEKHIKRMTNHSRHLQAAFSLVFNLRREGPCPWLDVCVSLHLRCFSADGHHHSTGSAPNYTHLCRGMLIKTALQRIELFRTDGCLSDL